MNPAAAPASRHQLRAFRLVRLLVSSALVIGLGAQPSTAEAPPPAATSQLPEIVARAIDFHGGDGYAKFLAELQLCSRSGCFDLVVQEDGGSFDYTAAGVSRDGHVKVRVTNNRVERWLDGEPQAVSVEDEQRWRDWVSSKVYFCFLPHRLADPRVDFRDMGTEDWNGRRLHKVKVTFEAGSSTDASDEYLYWFDPETARLEQFAYSFEGNPGGLRLRQGHNYRRAGELLFFDQHNLGAEGDDLRVDDLNPAMAAGLRTVSEVECRNPKVTHPE